MCFNQIIYARKYADLSLIHIFEEICKQYLWKLLLSGEGPVEFSSLGRWWGNDPKEKRQTEIDILAEQDKNTALFGAGIHLFWIEFPAAILFSAGRRNGSGAVFLAAAADRNAK